MFAHTVHVLRINIEVNVEVFFIFSIEVLGWMIFALVEFLWSLVGPIWVRIEATVPEAGNSKNEFKNGVQK